MRPYSLDRLQRDIERFYRTGDGQNTLDASKKMLKNGLLGSFQRILIKHIDIQFFFRLSQTCRTYR